LYRNIKRGRNLSVGYNLYYRINGKDIEKALKTSKNLKTPETNGINMELTKYLTAG
jgi:hypothetical protein